MKSFSSPIDNMSIKNKILSSYILIIVISLASLAFFANRVSTNAIIEKARHNSIRELALVSRSLSTIVAKTESIAKILVTNPSLQKNLQLYLEENGNNGSRGNASPGNIDIRGLLYGSVGSIIQPNSGLATFSLLSIDGKNLDLGDFDEESLQPIFHKEYISAVIDKRIPVWSGIKSVKLKSGDSRNVFAVSKLVIDVQSGDSLGIAVIYVKESEINSTYLSEQNTGNEAFYIIDESGCIISSNNKKELFKDFKQQVNSIYGVQFDYFGDGCKVFASGSNGILFTVNTFSKLNWRIVSVVPISEITSESRDINKLIVIIGVFCLIFSVATSFWVSRSITKPILNLVEIMKAIDRGNLEPRAQIGSNNEIGLIAKGFNELMGRVQKLINSVYNEQKLKRELEFKLVQSQVKPHFLYNTLETIISLIKLKMYEEAINTSKSMAGFYKYSLSKGNDIISIADEIQIIKNYLNIQKVRYNKYMDYSIDVEEGILEYRIPKLTLQPLVENSIYHGLKPKASQGRIAITGYLRDKTVIIEVFDDGIGISDEKINRLLEIKHENGNRDDFGLGSVNSRIKLIYGDEYGITIESEEGEYTRILVFIPAVEIRRDKDNV